MELPNDDFLANTEAIRPDDSELKLDNEQLKFLFEQAPQLNYLIDLAGFSARTNIELHGAALAAITAFAFKKGIKYCEELNDLRPDS